VTDDIVTSRLRLRPLTAEQLTLCLTDVPALERQLNLLFSHDVFDPPAVRAIRMKLEKTAAAADISTHNWLTYWVIVVPWDFTGAGLIGFKGYPNERGEAEIGYGISAD